ncbi:MAG TPA: hypothetical protein VII38_00855, partial [Polyangia bacterium]
MNVIVSTAKMIVRTIIPLGEKPIVTIVLVPHRERRRIDLPHVTREDHAVKRRVAMLLALLAAVGSA